MAHTFPCGQWCAWWWRGETKLGSILRRSIFPIYTVYFRLPPQNVNSLRPRQALGTIVQMTFSNVFFHEWKVICFYLNYNGSGPLGSNWLYINILSDNCLVPKTRRANIWTNAGLVYHRMSRVSCQKGPTRHAYEWQIGPFWQDTLDICVSRSGWVDGSRIDLPYSIGHVV